MPIDFFEKAIEMSPEFYAKADENLRNAKMRYAHRTKKEPFLRDGKFRESNAEEKNR